MSRIAAVLFDLDGVLVDATEWHYAALNRALSMFGYTIHRYEHVSVYNGLPTSKKLEMITAEKGLPPGLHGLIRKLKQGYTHEEIMRKCGPVFDKELMVRRLKRDGLRMAVCSNAVRDSVEQMLSLSGLLPFFEFCLSNEDIARPKPDPEMYHLALKRLRLPADQVVVVEDAGPGVEAARRAGVHVCQVRGFTDVDYVRIREFVNRVEAESS